MSKDIVLKLKGEISNFNDKTIGIICTNNKIGENALIELKNTTRIAICNVKDLINCIKKCHEKY